MVVTNTTPNRANTDQPAVDPRRQSGVTLIEVLVTVLVLSIGLIGLASLQGNALKANHSAYMRAQATILAQDMLDTMRVDRNEALGQAYDRDFGDPPGAGEENRWITDLQNTLPNAKAEIKTDTSDDTVTISIKWDDDRADDVDPTETFTLRTRL